MSELDKIKNIIDLLNNYKSAIHNEISTYLSLSSQLCNLINNSKNKPKYQLNIFDIIGATEPLTSKIISLIFKYNKDNEYILYNSFIKDFLMDCGFDSKWIKSPTITAETERVDIGIQEKGKYAIIIENKLKGAHFQRNQIARYIQKMIDSGYPEERIFIIILPCYIDRLFFNNINKSVWYLPKDWKTPNQERICSYNDSISCYCDYGKTSPICKECKKDLRYKFKNRTVILDIEFINWLENRCLSLLPADEFLLRSTIIQFVDFLKGIFNNRLNHKLIMEIEQFLREQLINSDAPLFEQWKTIEGKKEDINKLIMGLEKLQTSIGKEQIDEWRELLMPKWRQWLKHEHNLSFGINIQGVWCGCWCDDGEKPYWGFQCDCPTSKQEAMVKKILDRIDNLKYNTEKGWIAWCYTWHGDTRCDMFYEAALELGYLK